MSEELNILEQMIKLVVDNKLDVLEYGSYKVVKTRHDAPKLEPKPNNNEALSNDDELDELLFHSTSAPKLTLDDLQSSTVTKLKV